MYSKPTNSFTYVLPSTCYQRKNINIVPRGIALSIRRICDNDEIFAARSKEYGNYLIARGYNTTLVKKQFTEVSNIARVDARKKTEKKNTLSKVKFITTYNPSIPDVNQLIRKYIPVLHGDDSLKTMFPTNYISTVYKRNSNLKEILAPSLNPAIQRDRGSSITSCKKCDICKNYLVTSSKFVCQATGKKFYLRGHLNCESKNIIYIIYCKKYAKTNKLDLLSILRTALECTSLTLKPIRIDVVQHDILIISVVTPSIRIYIYKFNLSNKL